MTGSSSARTLLVVDDDPAVIATYRRLLSRAGYRTLTATDPREVVAGGLAQGVDLLLLDYTMPGMDGLSLLASLRAAGCRARCIVVSAFLGDGIESRAAELGVDRVLQKPVDSRVLLGAIGDLIAAQPGPGFDWPREIE